MKFYLRFFARRISIIYIYIFKGTCPKRRDKIEQDLNESFQEMVDQDFNIVEAYSQMVAAKASKVLSGWTYECKPKPLRSSRTAGLYQETDVSIQKCFKQHFGAAVFSAVYFYFICIRSLNVNFIHCIFSRQFQAHETEDESSPPEFKEFSKLLLDGQKTANETKRTYMFTWRGYKACISSQLPKLNNHELRRRFDLAMQSIKKGETTESFKKPFNLSQTSSSGSQPQSSSQNSSYSSSRISSESDEPTQIPETQIQETQIHDTQIPPTQMTNPNNSSIPKKGNKCNGVISMS